MARTESTMLPLGTSAPDFRLLDPVTGRMSALSDFASADALLIAFICNHCPFVKHSRRGFAEFAKESASSGLQTIAINSNDVDHYPADAPDMMVAEAKQAGYSFPYLFDETQIVAKLYRAACTPDFFLFDRDRKLVYRGRFDGSTPGNDIPVTGKDLRAATAALLAGGSPAPDQMPSMGCNIKWKPGNEPDYFR